MLLLTQFDSAVSQRLEEELAQVDSRLAAELISELPCVNSLVAHLERYRGKMLRPMLHLVTAMACSPTGQDVTEAHRIVAAVTELVHLATLVHDDVLDEAQIRRRGATINHLHGNETAVMLGDYLISHAYHLCSALDSTTASRVIADTTNTVCEGELLQLTNSHNRNLDEATYFEIIRRKTASLCGACCRLGSLLSEAPPDLGTNLYAYGEKLGVAYQIIDDVLDLTGTEKTVGKTLGRDLEKGKLTLPLIHFLTSTTGPQQHQMLDLLPKGPDGNKPKALSVQSYDNDRAVKILRLLTDHDCVGYASQWANRLVEEAKTSLQGVPEGPAKALLIDMADAVLTRKF